LAVPYLESLHRNSRLQAVITSPDQPAGRGYDIKPPAVKIAAENLGVPVLQPERVKTPEFLQQIKSFDADVAIVVAYGKLLPEPVLAATRLGFVNVHFSLLPAYRGAAPVQWSLINGDKETGVSLFWLDAGMDTGPIYLQKRTPIDPREDSRALWDRLVRMGVEGMEEMLQKLAAGEVLRVPQTGESSHARMLTKEDGRVDWTQPAQAVFDRFRGVSPWPGAYTYVQTGDQKTRLKLISVAVESSSTSSGEPGRIVDVVDREKLIVRCGQGTLALYEVQPEGKKAMPVWSFWQGARLKIGDRLENNI